MKQLEDKTHVARMSQSRGALGYVKYRGDCLLAYDRTGKLLGSFSEAEAYAAVAAILQST